MNKKDENIAKITNRAYELAMTGKYNGWREIENALRLRQGIPEAKLAFASTETKNIINNLCVESRRYKIGSK